MEVLRVSILQFVFWMHCIFSFDVFLHILICSHFEKKVTNFSYLVLALLHKHTPFVPEH